HAPDAQDLLRRFLPARGARIEHLKHDVLGARRLLRAQKAPRTGRHAGGTTHDSAVRADNRYFLHHDIGEYGPAHRIELVRPAAIDAAARKFVEGGNHAIDAI